MEGEVRVADGTALAGARVVADGRVLEPGHVVVQDGRIAAVGEGGPPGDGPVHDLGGAWLLPGFVDLHVHGGGGGDLTGADPDGHRTAARFHGRHGTTSLLATTVTSSPEDLAAAVAALRTTMRAPTDGARIAGINLEGPWLAEECRGAHDPALIRDPGLGEFARLADLADGALRVVTLAPERPGAAELADAVRAARAVVSLGHTAASYEAATDAVARGAALVTHVFNGMHPMHHRRPGMVGAALASPELTCELIADGLHVHPGAVRALVRAKGAGRVALVTDCLAAAGLPEGEHELGGRSVTVSGGLARVTGTGTIAGSTLTMDEAVRNAVRFAGVTVPEASRMASATPARLLGLPGISGRLVPGDLADLVVLDDGLAVRATMVGGRWIHRDDTVPA
jgi:N-acetylglucosamine-6-phosphate deacetylase